MPLNSDALYYFWYSSDIYHSGQLPKDGTPINNGFFFFSVNKHASQIPFSLKFNSGFVSGNKHDLQYLIDSRILEMIIEYKVCLSKYCKFNYLGIMNTMNQIIFYL
jgi:hypothetical protein